MVNGVTYLITSLLVLFSQTYKLSPKPLGSLPKLVFDDECDLREWDLLKDLDGKKYNFVDKLFKSDLFHVGFRHVEDFRKCFSGEISCSMRPDQSINLLPLDKSLAYKYRLTELLYKDPKMKLNEQFYPKSYNLHMREERDEFLNVMEENYGPSLKSRSQCCIDCFESEQKKNFTCPYEPEFWMFKPGFRSLGSGIFLLDPNYIDDIFFELQDEHTLELIINNQNYTAQRYISNPFLYDEKYKCSLRTYFLIASLEPLLVLTFPDVLVMCAGMTYTMKGGFEDSEIAITNAHFHSKYTHTRPLLDFKEYNEYIESVWTNPETKWKDKYHNQVNRISAYITRSFRDHVFTELPELVEKGSEFPHFYQTFGLDVILDSDFKVWVTEVQGQPSFELGTNKKQSLVKPLVVETFDIIFEVRERLAEEEPNFENMKSVKQFQWVIQGERDYYPYL